MIKIAIGSTRDKKYKNTNKRNITVLNGKGKAKTLRVADDKYAIATVISKIVFKYVSKGSTEFLISASDKVIWPLPSVEERNKEMAERTKETK